MMKKAQFLWILAATFELGAGKVFAEQITVFAAASLTNVLQQIGEAYQKDYPSDRLTFSFAGSSTLAKQIEQDAPADIFISADQKWLDYVAEKLPQNTKNIKTLVENELVLIAPQHSELAPSDIQSIDFKGILKENYLAVGDDNVPVGRYAKNALTHLGLWDTVEPRLAKAKDVRAVLTYVERGEVPLGIVYATDAKVSKKVKIVAVFPQVSYGKVAYPAATLSDKPEAKRFLDYLNGEQATALFQQAGFKPATR